MKKLIYILSLMGAAFVAAACNDDDNRTLEPGSPGIISVSASLLPATAQWQNDDRVGVYIYNQDAVPGVNIYRGIENAQWRTAAGNTSALSPVTGQAPEYPGEGDIEMMAYYPYRSDLEYSTYPVDVTDQSDPRAVDLLYAKTNRSYGASYNGDIPLKFSSVLSHVVINLTETGGVGMTGAQAVLSGMMTRGWYNLSSREFTYHYGSVDDIGMALVTDAQNPNKATASAILIPYSDLNGHRIIFEFAGDISVGWVLPAGTELEAGNVYTYNLSVDAENGDVVLLNATIDPWEDEIKNRVMVAVAGGDVVALEKTGAAEIYEGTLSLPGQATFRIAIEDQMYGFTKFSGNGGVGMISAAYSSTECPTLTSFPNYSVDKSFGQLSQTGEALWSNTGEAANVKVRVDLTKEDGVPRYYLSRVAAADPSLLLEEKFDLITWGGGWHAGKSGRAPANTTIGTYDGSEPTTRTMNNVTPYGPMSCLNVNHAAFVSNMGLAGWDLEETYMWFGMVMLNSSTAVTPRHIITPALTALAAPADVTVEFDILRFGSANNVTFEIVGAGAIASATYRDIVEPDVTYNIGYQKRADTPVAVSTIAADGKSIALTTRQAADEAAVGVSPTYINVESSHSSAKFKTRLTVSVTGATGQTKLKWSSEEGGSAYRCCLDNVRITK